MPTVQEAYPVENFRYSTSLFSSPKRSLRLGTLYHRCLATLTCLYLLKDCGAISANYYGDDGSKWRGLRWSSYRGAIASPQE